MHCHSSFHLPAYGAGGPYNRSIIEIHTRPLCLKTKQFQDLVLAPHTNDRELWRWLYTELRAGIIDGRLKRGSRIPSSRSLARQYGLSRATVTTAFEQLRAEGYTRTETGSGTYVASGLPDCAMVPENAGPTVNLPPSNAIVSKHAQELLKNIRVLPASRSMGKAFRSYEPAIDLFPVESWARVASRVLRRAPRSLYGQGEAAGYLPLRRVIAEYIGGSRGVRCSQDQIIVTSGAQQGLDLIARVLIDPGDPVWMEDPGYPGAWSALRNARAKLVPVPIDNNGLNVNAGRELAPRAKLAYVTPANQFPLGVTMSANRRMDLLNWAAGAGAWIVEDEYDAEYRYFGRPVAALQSLDCSGSVIYVGTFTKMLFNALRLGFLVVPERLVSAFQGIKSCIDRHPPTLDQAILAEFIMDGHFGHHVRRMRQTYSERMSILKQEAAKQLAGLLDVQDAAAGMRTLAWLNTRTSDEKAAEQARASGLETIDLSAFTLEHAHAPALILGFAGCSAGELRRGVSVLAAALRPPAHRNK